MSRRSAVTSAAGRRAQGGGGVSPLFFDSFPNFNRWNSAQWSTSGAIRNSRGNEYSGTGEYSCSVVSIDGRPDVARFELRNGDIPFSGTERTEIGEPFVSTTGDLQVTTGDERWIAWDMKFDSTWPTPVSWCLVWQWHHNGATGSPPLTLIPDESGNIVISNDDEVILRTIQVMQLNVWQRWIVHAKFSSDPAVGFVEVWVDGVQKLAKTFQRTMIVGDSGNYFKTGIYRDAAHTATMIRYTDNFAIWNVKPPELP